MRQRLARESWLAADDKPVYHLPREIPASGEALERANELVLADYVNKGLRPDVLIAVRCSGLEGRGRSNHQDTKSTKGEGVRTEEEGLRSQPRRHEEL